MINSRLRMLRAAAERPLPALSITVGRGPNACATGTAQAESPNEPS